MRACSRCLMFLELGDPSPEAHSAVESTVAQSWTAPQGCTGCTPNRCTWPTDLHTSSPLVQQSSGRAFPEFFRVLLRQLDLTGKVKSFEENWRSTPVYRGLGMLRREMVLPILSFEAHLSCGRQPQEISVAEKTASNQHFRCPPPKIFQKAKPPPFLPSLECSDNRICGD